MVAIAVADLIKERFNVFIAITLPRGVRVVFLGEENHKNSKPKAQQAMAMAMNH
jgi:hypothetical protein